MNASLGLLIFLLFDCFIIGMVAAVALRHALAHFRPDQHAAEHVEEEPFDPTTTLSKEERRRLKETASLQYQSVLNKESGIFDHELAATTEQINQQVRKLSAAVVSEELERYRMELVGVRQEAVAKLGAIHQGLEEQRTRMEQDLEKDIESEKQRIIQQIDTRLSDAVTSFLLETLQHEVDLGAQSQYLLKMLEAHKEDLKKEVAA